MIVYYFFKKLKTVTTFIFCLISVSAAKASSVYTNSGEKPNIVIFFIDDLGWTDLGCYGSDYYQTPAIDKLADQGVKFTNAYSACTVCSPSRAALMTGKYPARTHITDWIKGHNYPWAKLRVPDWTMCLPLEEETIAETLKKDGYATWHIGKWHLGDEEEYWPENQGFDINIAGNYKGMPIKKKAENCGGYFSPYCLPRIADGPKGEYLTDRLTEEAVNLIEQHHSKPFFLHLSHYAVHTPIQGKKEKVEKYKLSRDTANNHQHAAYAAMVESVDESVEKVLRALKKNGILDNTLIFFASDNGALKRFSSNAPLREGKGWAYEGGIRTPLIVYWKGKIEGGKVVDEPVITMDISSTILDVIGHKQPDDIDGISLMPLIMKNKYPKRALYWHYPHYHAGKPHAIVRDGDWKLIHFFESNHYELYNLKSDIGEQKNLFNKYPQEAEKLKKKLHSWQKTIGAQFMEANPDYDPLKERKMGKYKGK